MQDSTGPDYVPQMLMEYVRGSEHADLQVYRRNIAHQVSNDAWLWRMKHFCDLGQFYNKRILEVGAGFGWDAVTLSLIGNNEVIASDILPSMVEGMTECVDAMKSKGKPVRVTPLQGDICTLDLPDGAFGGIFSTEAIEHVHDLDQMFRNCYRLLRHGGRAVLVNDSNRYNEQARQHSWEGWGERDESWEHVEWLKTEVRPVEHKYARPYGVMREDVIRAAAPDLSDQEVLKLRHATAGMISPEVKEAAAQYRLDGSLPVRDEYRWCRNPETGEYSERLLDPFELKKMLIAAGFSVQLRHVFRKMPWRLANGVQFRPLNIRLFATRPLFALVATKN